MSEFCPHIPKACSHCDLDNEIAILKHHIDQQQELIQRWEKLGAKMVKMQPIHPVPKPFKEFYNRPTFGKGKASCID